MEDIAGSVKYGWINLRQECCVKKNTIQSEREVL